MTDEIGMKKQIVVIVVMLLLSLSLCGCNENTNNSQNNENNDDNQNVKKGNTNLEIPEYTVTTFIIVDEDFDPDIGTGSINYDEEDGFVHHENASFYEIAGKIKNSGNQPYIKVNIIAKFYDEKSIYLRNITDDIWLMAMGEEVEFSLQYKNSFENFDQVESIDLEVTGTLWSDASTDCNMDGYLSGPKNNPVGKWYFVPLDDGDYKHYLLNDEGLREFSISDYGEYSDGDHVYITGEYAYLNEYYFALKVESISHSTTPVIDFSKDSQTHIISVTSVESADIPWSDLLITGDCDTSTLGEYLTNTDRITECSGNIIITYISNGFVMADYKFDELSLLGSISTSDGNIKFTVDDGSLTPSNAKIAVKTPPNGAYLYDPDPGQPYERSTVSVTVIDPETMEPLPNDGHDFTFEWKDNNGNEKIDTNDVFTISNTGGLDEVDWQIIIYHRYADVTLYDSGIITIT